MSGEICNCCPGTFPCPGGVRVLATFRAVAAVTRLKSALNCSVLPVLSVIPSFSSRIVTQSGKESQDLTFSTGGGGSSGSSRTP